MCVYFSALIPETRLDFAEIVATIAPARSALLSLSEFRFSVARAFVDAVTKKALKENETKKKLKMKKKKNEQKTEQSFQHRHREDVFENISTAEQKVSCAMAKCRKQKHRLAAEQVCWKRA